MGPTITISPCTPIILLHYTLAYTDAVPEGNYQAPQVTRGEPSGKFCEIADAPARFKSDVWKHFGFPPVKNVKGEKVTERYKKNNMQTMGGHLG